MIVKYFNFYFLFFSVALSAAVFPSSLGNYNGFQINLGFGIFILDEILILLSLLMMFITTLTKKISNQITGYGSFLYAFVLFIIFFFAISIIRENNSLEIISRDRWIILNSLVLFYPFIYRPSNNDLEILFKHFLVFNLFLLCLKYLSYFILGSENIFSNFGPGFNFIINFCLAIYIYHGSSNFIKILYAILALTATIINEQISGIIFSLLCIFIPFYFLVFKVKLSSIFFLIFISFFFHIYNFKC